MNSISDKLARRLDYFETHYRNRTIYNADEDVLTLSSRFSTIEKYFSEKHVKELIKKRIAVLGSYRTSIGCYRTQFKLSDIFRTFPGADRTAFS